MGCSAACVCVLFNDGRVKWSDHSRNYTVGYTHGHRPASISLSLSLQHTHTHTHTQTQFSATVSVCETVLTFGLMSFAVVMVNFDLGLAEAVYRRGVVAEDCLILSIQITVCQKMSELIHFLTMSYALLL